jgi:hypothetical protein
MLDSESRPVTIVVLIGSRWNFLLFVPRPDITLMYRGRAMGLLVVALFATVDRCPKVWTLDMSSLPVNSPIDYRFTINLELPEGKGGGLTFLAYETSNPEELHTGVYGSIAKRRGWKVAKKGLTITLREAEGEQIRRITVEGNGPKPTVRWEFATPPKK